MGGRSAQRAFRHPAGAQDMSWTGEFLEASSSSSSSSVPVSSIPLHPPELDRIEEVWALERDRAMKTAWSSAQRGIMESAWSGERGSATYQGDEGLEEVWNGLGSPISEASTMEDAWSFITDDTSEEETSEDWGVEAMTRRYLDQTIVSSTNPPESLMMEEEGDVMDRLFPPSDWEWKTVLGGEADKLARSLRTNRDMDEQILVSQRRLFGLLNHLDISSSIKGKDRV